MKKYHFSAILYSRNSYDYLLNLKNICNKFGINLIYERDFYNLLHKSIKILPHLILIDGTTVNVNSFPFSSLKNDIFEYKTKIVIISNDFTCDNKFIKVIKQDAIQNYISTHFYKSFDFNNYVLNGDCGNNINNLLLSLGFSPNLKGKDYLKLCINLIINDGVHFRCLSKDCYPILALTYNTEVSNIERDIRNAIRTSYLKANLEFWEKQFNCILNKTPSNKQFIYLCVDKIKQEL